MLKKKNLKIGDIQSSIGECIYFIERLKMEKFSIENEIDKYNEKLSYLRKIEEQSLNGQKISFDKKLLEDVNWLNLYCNSLVKSE